MAGSGPELCHLPRHIFDISALKLSFSKFYILFECCNNEQGD